MKHNEWWMMVSGRIEWRAMTARTAAKSRRYFLAFSVVSLTALLAACGSAPVGPGFYRVERGDTLSAIARKNRQSTAALVRWNNISNPNQIEVNQVLRVAPPRSETALRTQEGRDTTTANLSADASSPPPRSRAEYVAPLPTGGPPASKTIALIWPAKGAILTNFDARQNKGIDIDGSMGDPVSAAAPGQVAYVGQLRGYGNLLIVKHSNGFLTSYAHLQRAMVKEGQTVSAGQQIATIGNTEAARAELHFELRYEGQPVNPMRYLPNR